MGPGSGDRSSTWKRKKPFTAELRYKKMSEKERELIRAEDESREIETIRNGLREHPPGIIDQTADLTTVLCFWTFDEIGQTLS